MIQKIELNDVLQSAVGKGPSSKSLSVYLPKGSKQQKNKIIEKIDRLLGLAPQKKDVIKKVREHVESVIELSKKHHIGWFLSDKLNGYVELHYEPKPLVVVSSSFHKKPLFKEKQRLCHFYVLDIDARQLSLFESEDENLKLLDMDIINDQSKEDIFNFKENYDRGKLRQVQKRSIDELLTRHEIKKGSLLILSGEHQTTAYFQKQLSYFHVTKESISIDKKMSKLIQLKEKSFEIAYKINDVNDKLVLKQASFCEKSKDVQNNLKSILYNAQMGRVQSLVVSEDVYLWGYLDLENASFKLNQYQKDFKDEDILDDISELVYRHKGNVWVMPQEKLGPNIVYATYRW